MRSNKPSAWPRAVFGLKELNAIVRGMQAYIFFSSSMAKFRGITFTVFYKRNDIAQSM